VVNRQKESSIPRAYFHDVRVPAQDDVGKYQQRKIHISHIRGIGVEQLSVFFVDTLCRVAVLVVHINKRAQILVSDMGEFLLDALDIKLSLLFGDVVHYMIELVAALEIHGRYVLHIHIFDKLHVGRVLGKHCGMRYVV